jgi:hypothetical protein
MTAAVEIRMPLYNFFAFNRIYTRQGAAAQLSTFWWYETNVTGDGKSSQNKTTNKTLEKQKFEKIWI